MNISLLVFKIYAKTPIFKPARHIQKPCFKSKSRRIGFLKLHKPRRIFID